MLFFSCFPGTKGRVIVGAVVGSIAALAVAAGIFVFLVWKSRKRNSNNSNGKSSIQNANFGPQQESRSIKQPRTVCVYCSLI